MITLTAIKSSIVVMEGKKYKLGGIKYNTNILYIMDKSGTFIIPGEYDCEEIFGITKKEIMDLI